MSERSVELLLEDIWEAIEKIGRYTVELSKNGFLENEKTIDAVVRNLEVIGEAANRLPDQFKMDNETIAWRKIIGLRNRIVHEYFGIDSEIVWQIIQADLPELKQKLEMLLP